MSQLNPQVINELNRPLTEKEQFITETVTYVLNLFKEHGIKNVMFSIMPDTSDSNTVLIGGHYTNRFHYITALELYKRLNVIGQALFALEACKFSESEASELDERPERLHS